MKRIARYKTEILNAFIALFCLGCGYKPVTEPVFFVGPGSAGEELPIKKTIEKDVIRVLCWNIHKENDRDAFRSTLGDLMLGGRPMEQWHPGYSPPDLVLLQEVFMGSPDEVPGSCHDPDFGGGLARSYKMAWVFAPNLLKNGIYGGVLTASTFKATESKAILSDGVEYWTKTPKAALITRYALAGSSRELMVVNVHGINIKLGLSDFKRQLQRILDPVKNHTGPVILAGDFNTWRLKRLRVLDDFAKEAGLEKVGFNEKKQSKSFMGLGYPLDHIYISADTLSVHRKRAYVLDKLNVSDHNPLWVELTFR